MKSGSITFVLLAVAATSSSAQLPATVPVTNWTYYNHASTAAEGYLRGQAAAIQATAQANYLNSLAAVNYAEANRRAIENNRLYVKTYIENRENVFGYRERYTRPPLSREQIEAFAKDALPDRLTEEQYSNGKIVWPHILRGEEYAAMRNRIDHLVALRTADNSGDGSPSQREIASLIGAWKLLLKQNIDSYSSSQYVNAKWFLRSLDYEMKFPLGSPTTASTPPAASTENKTEGPTSSTTATIN